ncbi:hypothetical protein SDC9_149504 [bioreactor metagenome]|uniref:Uncharacterized protein n=1 Tax=bioreactor metagenome TaxID=1076179 RepID=A0A645ELQ3_9ZZZZ
MPARGFGHPVHGVDDLGILEIAVVADGLAEIRRTEKDDVDPRCGADRVEFVHRFDIFDLNHDETVAVGEFKVFRRRQQGIQPIGITAVDRPPSHRSKARLISHFRRVGGAHHMRHHDARRIQLQRFHQIAVTAALNPHHQIDAISFGRQNLALPQRRIA